MISLVHAGSTALGGFLLVICDILVVRITELRSKSAPAASYMRADV